jgi:hypothetical protein
MNSTKESLDGLRILVDLIEQMEKKQGDHPEYVVKNIELVDKIIKILEGFKNELIDRLPTS